MKDIKSFISEYPNGCIAHCRDTEKSYLRNSGYNGSQTILIGPEGDFTEEEIEHALKNGYKPISLGQNRLRTETAGLYATMEALLIQQ
jgi:16S rRNA (uracil1498-N3)-methyltransferase